MDLYSGPINKLISELSTLPGIGEKSAGRLAFHLIGLPEEKVEKIAGAMVSARKNVRYCNCCYTLTDGTMAIEALGDTMVSLLNDQFANRRP